MTAREVAHAYLRWATNILTCSANLDSDEHNEACDRLAAAIESRDRAREAEVAVLREALAKAANYIESAADIIRDDAGGDEDDDLDAREFVAELRALSGSTAVTGEAGK